MKKSLILSLMLTLAVTSASAQALWSTAAAEFDITKKLSAGIEGEYRTTDNLSSTNRWAVEAGLGYKFSPYFKMGASYTFIYHHGESRTTSKGNIVDSYWQPRHRFSLEGTGSYRLGRLKLSLRERYQFTHHTEQSVAKWDGDDGSRKSDELIEAKDKHMLRSRLKADLDLRKSIFSPFASVEIYNSLTDGFAADQLRYTLGTELSLSKHHELELFYRFIDGRGGDSDLNVIGVGYKWKF